MSRTPSFPLYDRILEGRLSALLQELRAAGQSLPEIRDTLRDDYDISVSVATVRRWFGDAS